MQAMFRRLVLPLVLLGDLGGCGGSGSAPSPPIQLDLPAGNYLMAVGPTNPSTCTGTDRFFLATASVGLTIEPTADAWIGRTRTGELQMTLAAASTTSRIIPVSGTIGGTSVVASGLDSVILLGVRFSGASDAEPAVLTGTAVPPLMAIRGTIRGKISFLSGREGPLVCSVVEFTLFRE
jgi:hypothetical protein